MDEGNSRIPDVMLHSAHPISPSQQCYQSRLPTPEAAKGSELTMHGSIVSPAYKRPRYDPISNQSYETEHASRKRSCEQLSRSRRDSAVQPLPSSFTTEGQKPSLPSLRSVLTGNEISPPKTPSPRQARSHLPRTETLLPAAPAPHIPTPATIHSNKRQKLTHGDTQSSYYTTPVPRPFDRQLRPSISLPSLSAHLSTFEPGRTTSTKIVGDPPSGSSPLRPSLYTPVSEPFRSSVERTGCDRHTPDRTPNAVPYSRADSVIHYAHEPSQSYIADNREAYRFREHNDSIYPRTQHSRCCGGHSPHGYDRDYHAALPPRSEPRSSVSSTEGLLHGRDLSFGEPSHSHMMGFGLPGYTNLPGPPYYASSYFDYQQGKSRKRSNLPKHSTEVMKHWFDQNIQNPYPSEEQKQRFSNVTGISMTQVSNWFINHRRRCPELRDKREKGRGGRDDEC